MVRSDSYTDRQDRVRRRRRYPGTQLEASSERGNDIGTSSAMLRAKVTAESTMDRHAHRLLRSMHRWTLRMGESAIDFEAESVRAMGDLLGAETNAWCTRQCIDKQWWTSICMKNIRGNASKIKLRFVRKAGVFTGRATFSVLVTTRTPLIGCHTGTVQTETSFCMVCQKERLDVDGNPEPDECAVDWVSACRVAADGQPEYLVHWTGGIERWGKNASTWQSLDSAVVLATWESELEQLVSSSSALLHTLDQLLQAAPLRQPLVGRWIKAKVRGSWSNAEVIGFNTSSSWFKLQFEQLQTGQADPDDGEYDLLNGEVEWHFTSEPQPLCTSSNLSSSAQERVARRNRH